MPYTCTPASGWKSILSHVISSITLKSKASLSIAITNLRAKFCMVAVKYACGKNSPEIHTHIGFRVSIQSCMNHILFSMSFVQKLSGIIDSGDTFSNAGGTWLLYSAPPTD